MSRWTDFVKAFAKKHNVSYGCALSMPDCSAEYRREHPNKQLQKRNEGLERLEMGANDKPAPESKKRSKVTKASKELMKQAVLKRDTIKEFETKAPAYLEHKQRKADTAGMEANDFDSAVKKYKRGRPKKGEIRVKENKPKRPRGRPRKGGNIFENIHIPGQHDATKISVSHDDISGNSIGGLIHQINNHYKKAQEHYEHAKNKTTNLVDSLLHGRKDLSPKAKEILNKDGNDEIAKIVVTRTPVPKYLTEIINAVSLGQFNKELAKQPYDTLFHLYLVIHTKGGKKIGVEKNDVITLFHDTTREKAEEIEIPVHKFLTLNIMMEKTKERMGDKFIPYNARNCNCQDFVLAMLKANGLDNPQVDKFVKQNVNSVIRSGSFAQKFVNNITQLGEKVDILRQGAGAESSSGESSSGTGSETEEEEVEAEGYGIDFSKIKEGSFTRQLKTFNRKHKKNLSLEQFAKFIISHKEDFSKLINKRALFYLNILDKKNKK